MIIKHTEMYVRSKFCIKACSFKKKNHCRRRHRRRRRHHHQFFTADSCLGIIKWTFSGLYCLLLYTYKYSSIQLKLCICSEGYNKQVIDWDLGNIWFIAVSDRNIALILQVQQIIFCSHIDSMVQLLSSRISARGDI